MNCRSCPYFEKRKTPELRKGLVILGFCRLRQKLVADSTINEKFCKDRAVIS